MISTFRSIFEHLNRVLNLHVNYERPPVGLEWRSNTFFIISTVAVGLFTDLFFYGLIVPVLPYILEDRVSIPPEKTQTLTSILLACYAGASVVFAPITGFIADKASSRQTPFLFSLVALLLATILLYVGSSVSWLVIARVLQGISGAFVWTVGLTLICHDTVSPSNLGKTLGTMFSFISVASLLGPLLGGLLYEKAGYEGLFGLAAALLVVDFAMRLLVIEKRSASLYYRFATLSQNNEEFSDSEHNDEDEETLLLPDQESKYKISADGSKVAKHFPLIFCFRHPGLIVAFIVAFAQAALLGAFDSTVPLEAKQSFGFDSLWAGVLFIPLSIGNLLMGPLAGWAVDRFGTKSVGTRGFAFLVPVLVALRAVDSGDRDHIIIYCTLLVLCGVGLYFIGAPSIVEAGRVVQKYHKANPGLFPEAGPYGQLYGMNGVCFSAGLTLGPIIGGTLRESIGYGNMNAVMACICAVTAILCFIWLGGSQKV